MPVKITHRFVVLSEGLADKNFLSKLIATRLAGYDCDFPYPSRELGGVNAFETMLRGIRGDQVGFGGLKGVLIVADSASDPAAVFSAVQEQIRRAGGFSVPTRLSQPAPRTDNHPPVCVMLMPSDSSPGGLETLCNEALRQRFPNSEPCIEEFLNCEPDPPASWSPEKRDKARYHAYVASCFQPDPSRALSFAFKEPSPENPQALLQISAPTFDEITDRIRSVLDSFLTL